MLNFDALSLMLDTEKQRNRTEPVAEFEVVDTAEAQMVATDGAAVGIPSLQMSSDFVRGMVSNISNPFRSAPSTVQIGVFYCTLSVRCGDDGVVELTPEDTHGGSTHALAL